MCGVLFTYGVFCKFMAVPFRPPITYGVAAAAAAPATAQKRIASERMDGNPSQDAKCGTAKIKRTWGEDLCVVVD